MKQEIDQPNDEKLSALLRGTRPTPSLPPRFQEGVWRRIEESDIPTAVEFSWVKAVSWGILPRFALAAALVLIAAGSIFGAREGIQAARQNAQSRYIASVAPNSLR